MQYVLQFLGHSGRLYGTLGQPVDFPDAIVLFKDRLEDIEWEGFGAYLVVPYNDQWLRTEAMVDYVWTATRWD